MMVIIYILFSAMPILIFIVPYEVPVLLVRLSCFISNIPFNFFFFFSFIRLSFHIPSTHLTLHFSATSDFMSFHINKLFTSISWHGIIQHGHCPSLLSDDERTHFINALISIFVTFLYLSHAKQSHTLTFITQIQHKRLLESPRDHNNTSSSSMMASEIDFPSQFINNKKKQQCYSPLSLMLFRFYYYVLFLSVAYSNESMLNKNETDDEQTGKQQTTVPFNVSAMFADVRELIKQKLVAKELQTNERTREKERERKKSVNTSFCQIKKKTNIMLHCSI